MLVSECSYCCLAVLHLLDSELAGDGAHLVKVEYEVQLTDVAKVLVQHLHIVVDDLQCDELIFTGVNPHHKVQAGIPLVYNLQAGPESKICHTC